MLRTHTNRNEEKFTSDIITRIEQRTTISEPSRVESRIESIKSTKEESQEKSKEESQEESQRKEDSQEETKEESQADMQAQQNVDLLKLNPHFDMSFASHENSSDSSHIDDEKQETPPPKNPCQRTMRNKRGKRKNQI